MELPSTTEIERPKRRKRRGQRGSIVARNGGFSIVYRMPNGKQKWESGFPTKGAAQDRVTDVLRDIRDNKFVQPSELLFRQFCETWLEGAKNTLKPKTWTWYSSALKKWILPEFGDWPLCDINRAAVFSFKDKLLANQTISRKFIKNVTILLHRLFEEAIDRELIASNPARKLRIPTDERPDRNIPKGEDILVVLSQLTPTLQFMVVVSALTGARRGELCGLLWEDIDQTQGVIFIRRALQPVTKKLLESGAFRNVEQFERTGLAFVTPKSKTSRRKVEMGPMLTSLLAEWRKRQENGSKFVFHDELGKPFDPNYVSKALRKARKAAGVNFSLHDMRHLHASLLVASGADVKRVQERLGHADAQTTLNIYSHVVNEDSRKCAEKAEAALAYVSEILAPTPNPAMVN